MESKLVRVDTSDELGAVSSLGDDSVAVGVPQGYAYCQDDSVSECSLEVVDASKGQKVSELVSESIAPVLSEISLKLISSNRKYRIYKLKVVRKKITLNGETIKKTKLRTKPKKIHCEAA